MRLAIALLCSALMMCGCSDVNAVQHDLSRLLSIKDASSTTPPKKASPTFPPKGPVKAASGPGATRQEMKLPECPKVDPAAYAALEQPEPLPPAKPLLSPNDVKRWIERSEDRILDLKQHLRASTAALSACHSKL